MKVSDRSNSSSSYITLIEYSALVETSQTHRRTVHHEFYVKKRKALEDARTIPNALSKISPNPMENLESSRYDEILLHHQQQQVLNESLLAVDPVVIPQRTYGRGRQDYDIKGKRYPWIPEEINYFHQYFRSVEPFLNEDQQKHKYATCLATLLQEGDEVLQYFHPHHLENSDRIKTGYLKARETFRG